MSSNGRPCSARSALKVATQAAAHPAAAEEVGRDREVARGGEPAGVLADVVVEAERLVEHDDARPRPVADRRASADVRREVRLGSISTFRVPGDDEMLERVARALERERAR